MAATPRWVLRTLTLAANAPTAAAWKAEREIITRAADLSFSELIDLLHARAEATPPDWWTAWSKKRHDLPNDLQTSERPRSRTTQDRKKDRRS